MPAKVGEQEVGGLADIRRQSQDCAEGRRWADRIAQEGSGSGYVTGVDLSAEMIRLAEESERRRPLGCLYVRADAARFQAFRAGRPCGGRVPAQLRKGSGNNSSASAVSAGTRYGLADGSWA